jgi:ABC-type spermidine/putrescine transport system permease subunit I
VGWPWPALPLSLYLVLGLVVPCGVLVVYSFWTADFFSARPDLTLDNYVRAVTGSIYRRVLWNSLWIGLVTAGITIPVAFAIAYGIRFRLTRTGNAVLMLIMVSMLSTYLVRIYAWKTILGPEGLINNLLMGAGLIEQPIAALLYGQIAIILALVHILLPYAVLPIFAALQNIDPRVLEAGRDLGASPMRRLLTITLPLAWPGLRSAFAITFMLAAADYVTPQLVGGSSSMMLGRIIADQFGMASNPPFGAALAILLVFSYGALALVFCLGARIVKRLWSPFMRFARRWHAHRAHRHMNSVLNFDLPILESFIVLALAFLYIPLIIVIVVSFNASSAGVFPIQGWSLRWYEALFDSPAFMKAAYASLLVGLLAVTGSLVLGVPAAFGLARANRSVGRWLLLLMMGPIAVPGIVIGIAILAMLSMLTQHGGLYVTAAVHILVTAPFVVLVLDARLRRFDRRIEEAGRDLGSSPFRVFRTITLPILAPTILASAILAAALSLDEFIVTNFVIGANTTLPVYIWGQMRTGVTPSVNAVASIIMISCLILLVTAGLLLLRQSRRQKPLLQRAAA